MTVEERYPATKDDFKPINQIFYGTASGAAGKIAEYPLDTLMVRLQAQSMGDSAKGEHFDGIIDCVRQSLRNGGISGLYRGLIIPLSACIIETSVSFLSYTYVQSKLVDLKKQKTAEANLNSNKVNYDLSIPELCFCGASSGIPVSIMITPFELLKCRIQILRGNNVISNTDGGKAHVKATPISMLHSALAADGPLSLYRGYPGTFVREVGGGAVWFGVYEALARKFVEYRSMARVTKDDLTFPELFTCGAAAGIIYSVVTCPPDVIKCIQQTYLSRISTYQVMKSLLKYEGFKGLYRGLGVSLLRSSLSSGVTLGLYDILRAKVNLGI